VGVVDAVVVVVVVVDAVVVVVDVDAVVGNVKIEMNWGFDQKEYSHVITYYCYYYY